MKNLSQQAFLQIKFYFPDIPEQEKVVDCLSSIDKLILAQCQKIDELKAHKKGLFQQLFPLVEVAL